MGCNENIKRLDRAAGLYKSAGKYYMRLDEETRGAEITPYMYRLMRVALYGTRRLCERGGLKTKYLHKGINCHRAVYMLLGFTREMQSFVHERYTRGEHLYKHLPQKPLQTARSFEEMEENIRELLQGKLGVVQAVIPERGLREVPLVHSFIIGFDEKKRAVCFEKVGFSYGFRITSLYGAYSFYSLHCPYRVYSLQEFLDAEIPPLKTVDDVRRAFNIGKLLI